jgi:hypothetical protein
VPVVCDAKSQFASSIRFSSALLLRVHSVILPPEYVNAWLVPVGLNGRLTCMVNESPCKVPSVPVCV